MLNLMNVKVPSNTESLWLVFFLLFFFLVETIWGASADIIKHWDMPPLVQKRQVTVTVSWMMTGRELR